MSIFEDLVHEEFQSTDNYSKFRDTAVFLIDTVCTYLDLEHPAPCQICHAKGHQPGFFKVSPTCQKQNLSSIFAFEVHFVWKLA